MALKINFDYLKILEEVPLFCASILRHDFRKRQPAPSGTILIVNVSLVGEFAATAPVIHDYIAHRPNARVDLMVSPPLVPLARKMRGVRHVFSATSVFHRASERGAGDALYERHYEQIILMRISPDAYTALAQITSNELLTALPHLLRYGAHIAWHLMLGKTPRSWREVNFRVFDLPPRIIPFKEIFEIPSSEYEKVRAHPALQSMKKKIAIHTGASWPMNRWPLTRWSALLEKMHHHSDYEFIFVGGAQDEADYATITSSLPFRTSSLIGKTDLVELPLALSLCDFFIGVDSGPRNMAHLVDLPSITLLGPGPHMYTPPNKRDLVLDRSNGRGLFERYIAKNKGGCIEKISVEDVYRAFMVLSDTLKK